jgi:hypothetical protein
MGQTSLNFEKIDVADLIYRPLAKILCGMIMGYSYFNFWFLK